MDGTAGVVAAARAWLAEDPDPTTRAELEAVLADPRAHRDELADRFAGRLTFGTAGLRGPLRAGPNGMNLAVVRATAAALVAWLAQRQASGPLVIGYDARHRSRDFAEQTARVATGAGRDALLLPSPLPTPVLAYAVRALGASAGVMVTASHNPPQDNGYKVYLGEQLGGQDGAGAQIVPPVDAEIQAAIEAVGPLSAIPLGELGPPVDEAIVDEYLRRVGSVLASDTPRELTVAYTALHGVGGAVFGQAMRAAGFAEPLVVPEQQQPDPDFPTVPFPNPEEPGAMDWVVVLAQASGADIAIANDPDADRCAVAVPAAAGDGWQILRGDEVGVLLADHLIRRGVQGVYATTVVSSSMLRALCAARGQAYRETLTGFKWIVRAAGADLVYGYEEALGYCVAPDLVRDKDGISAALLVCELAAMLRAQGRTVSDRLDELAAEFGVYLTDQISIRVDHLPAIAAIMAAVRADPPGSLLGEPVIEQLDRAPQADVFTLRSQRARVVVRPSGTEPKLKTYLEVVEPVPDGDVAAARRRAATAMAALRDDVHSILDR